MHSSARHVEQGHQALLEMYLRALDLPMFLEHYQTYAKDATRSGLSCERFLLALCEAEMGHREIQRIERAIAAAKLPFFKELSSYEFGAVVKAGVLASRFGTGCPG